jgi:predicted DNA-binding protein
MHRAGKSTSIRQQVYLSEPVDDFLANVVSMSGMSRSDYLRFVIEQYLVEKQGMSAGLTSTYIDDNQKQPVCITQNLSQAQTGGFLDKLVLLLSNMPEQKVRAIWDFLQKLNASALLL